MRNWLENEYVILTGASSGIGRELCKILIQKYHAKVIGVGRTEEKMRSLQEELSPLDNQFSYQLFDIGKKEEWEEFSRWLSTRKIQPKVLINNAGAFPTFEKTQNLSSETVEKILQTNFLSAVYSIESLYKSMPKGSGIVNICSSAALCTIAGTAAYTASKAALKGYTEGLQLDTKGENYVAIFYPGTTATELFRNDEKIKNSALDKIAISPKKMAKKIAKKIHKKRRRAVLGWDAKLMNFTAKIAPTKGIFLIRGVMKTAKSKVFTDVFDKNKQEN